MDPESRFLAYATGQTAVLGLLAGLVGAMVLFTPFLFGLQHTYLASDLSGTAASATHRLLQVLYPTVLALYVLVPVVAWGVLTALGRDVPGTSGTALTALALLLVFTTGAVTGALAAGGLSETVRETRSGSPQVAFAFDYEPTDDGRGVLTITHDGGDAVVADLLVLQSEEIADVPGANQTRDGTWQGATSDVDWRGEPVVAQGDAVAVGVERDCVVRVVYADRATLGKYVCPGAESG